MIESEKDSQANYGQELRRFACSSKACLGEGPRQVGRKARLAAARACENHVFLVSSTYEDVSRNWMLTAVYDHDGHTLARAKDWGTIVAGGN